MEPRKRPIAERVVTFLLATGGMATLLFMARTDDYRSATRAALTFLVVSATAQYFDFLD